MLVSAVAERIRERLNALTETITADYPISGERAEAWIAELAEISELCGLLAVMTLDTYPSSTPVAFMAGQRYANDLLEICADPLNADRVRAFPLNATADPSD